MTRRTFIGSAAVIVLAPVADTASEQAGTSRRTLRAAVDRIIPAQGNMPAASAVGGVEYLEALSARDRDVQQRLATALTALGPSFAESSEDEQIGALEKLEKADPPSFAALRDAVYEAYYTNPKIWPLIGDSFRKGTKRTAPLEDFGHTGRRASHGEIRNRCPGARDTTRKCSVASGTRSASR